MEFNYYYGMQAEQFSFIKIPKVMITDPIFSTLSLPAKVLYGILLDRMSLSMKNRWFDSENRVYIIYQISDIQEVMGISKNKAIELLRSLEKFGLVEKKRRGLGMPSLLYVKSFLVQRDCSNPDGNQSDETEKRSLKSDETETSRSIKVQHLEGESFSDCRKSGRITAEMGLSDEENATEKNNKFTRSTGIETSRSPKIETSGGCQNETSRGPEMGVLNSNINNNNNKTDNSEFVSYPISSYLAEEDKMGCETINLEYQSYKELVCQNIDYDLLMENYSSDKELVDGILNLIVEMVMCQNEKVVIASNVFPREVVKSRFLKLNYHHIAYVIHSLQANTTKVKNIKKYLLAVLFNAPSTIEGYYQAEVNHDFPEFAG